MNEITVGTLIKFTNYKSTYQLVNNQNDNQISFLFFYTNRSVWTYSTPTLFMFNSNCPMPTQYVVISRLFEGEL